MKITRKQIDVTLDDKEIEILKKAHNTLRDIINTLNEEVLQGEWDDAISEMENQAAGCMYDLKDFLGFMCVDTEDLD